MNIFFIAYLWQYFWKLILRFTLEINSAIPFSNSAIMLGIAFPFFVNSFCYSFRIHFNSSIWVFPSFQRKCFINFQINEKTWPNRNSFSFFVNPFEISFEILFKNFRNCKEQNLTKMQNNSHILLEKEMWKEFLT